MHMNPSNAILHVFCSLNQEKQNPVINQAGQVCHAFPQNRKPQIDHEDMELNLNSQFFGSPLSLLNFDIITSSFSLMVKQAYKLDKSSTTIFI